MRKNDNKGFTFIELILYMAILGIFMVAVMSLVGSTVASNRKQKSRQKLQTQATEVYDTISDMLMGATNLKIYGKGYVNTGGTSYSETTANFIVPDSTQKKSVTSTTQNQITNAAGVVVGQKLYSGTGAVLTGIPLSDKTGKSLAPGTWAETCYDIADVKSFDGSDVSVDPETNIDTTYLWIKYCADIKDNSGKGTGVFVGDYYEDVVASCTVKYDSQGEKLYLVRKDVDASVYAGMTDAEKRKYDNYIDESSESGTLLAKNVTKFQMQVSPDTNSVALIIGFEDDKTGEKYEITGVVGLRNSFVLKKHEW